VLKRRKLISAVVFSFSLALSLNVFSHCLLDHDLSSSKGGEGAEVVSCLDMKNVPFLRSHNPHYEKNSFTRMQRDAAHDRRVSDLKDAAATMTAGSPRSVFVSFPVPIYQLQTVYRI
jgi:hypothetical protein